MQNRISLALANAAGACLLITSLAVAAEEPLTRSNGAPVGDNQNSQTAGPLGPTLLQSNQLIEKLAHFDRERIPERVVHARGTGAHGVFVSEEDLSEITRATLFSGGGKETPVFLRFSAVIHSKHSPETLRDPRGFAIKFYTEQGNWDLVGNNFPVFFIRDAIKFPDMVHSLKPDPVTNIQDPNRFFDFFSHIPESTHMLTFLYSPLGIPTSLREMNGSGVHAFKFVTAECEPTYVKFTWVSRQGEEGLSGAQAAEIQKTNFNHLTADLYENINAGNHPTWDLYIQTMAPADLDKYDFNPLDTTKIWPQELIPRRKVGHLTLNRVPDNFHQWTEQSAFSPANLVPGIEPSEDRMLQGRLFSYADTQRYRLGVNHDYLPVNRAKVEVNSHNQEGAGLSRPNSGSVNYQPSRTGEGFVDQSEYKACQSELVGTTQQIPYARTQNFKQAGALYRSFSKDYQNKLVTDFAGDLGQVKDAQTQAIILSFLHRADEDYGKRVAAKVGVDMAEVKAAAEQTAQK